MISVETSVRIMCKCNDTRPHTACKTSIDRNKSGLYHIQTHARTQPESTQVAVR
jgi:hypothetical protein